MPGIPLDARLKLHRARQHIHTLNHQVAHFGERDPYGETHEFERRGLNQADYVTRLDVKRPPLRQWAETIGDALHNMRATLDYLIWALWLETSGEPAKPREVEFPIFLHESKFRAGHAKRIGGLPDEAQAAIERLQPYHGLDPAAHPLWLLYELNNRDKHRFLETVLAAIYEAEAEVLSATNATVEDYWLTEGPVEHGAEILRVRVRAHALDPDVQMHLKTVFAIAFSESGPANGRAVVSLLSDMQAFIVNEVFAALDPFYA